MRGRDGQLVKLEAVATVKEGVGPRELNHFNRVRSLDAHGAAWRPGFTLGEAIDSLNRDRRPRCCREGSSTALAGESRELEESGSSLYFAFLLALVVVFMVLASQFESLVHPFTVLLAVPLAVTGALFTLKLAGSTLNLYSQIGMILLIGLVTKNSILLVEYTNQLKERGLDTVAAALRGGPDPAAADPDDVGRDGHGRRTDRARARAPDRSAGARSGYAIVGGVLLLDSAHPVSRAGGLRHLRRLLRRGCAAGRAHWRRACARGGRVSDRPAARAA